jgi:glycosyltransferase involved in cell wall biosynthesis
VSLPRTLMLVSDRADAGLRREVGEGRRPCPEYLYLEGRGVELLDWSRLSGEARRRSPWLAAQHAWAALPFLQGCQAVFSDGEHVGIPLALAMRAARRRVPHLMLGHHLTTRAKWPFFRILRAQDDITRILVHSPRQQALARRLGIPVDKVALVPYSVDTEFWAPRPSVAEGLVVAAGREHRDYATLARACEGLPIRVFVAAGSRHSPAATERRPRRWPDNFEIGFADPVRLRDLYMRASVVVVPLLPTDFQAGVTTILEAMAMGRPVVVTATEGQRELLVTDATVTVPPEDAGALRAAISGLLADPERRRRMGWAARKAVVERFSLAEYVLTLQRHLEDVAVLGPELARRC